MESTDTPRFDLSTVSIIKAIVGSALDSIDGAAHGFLLRAVAVCDDLERSLSLLDAVNRRYDDLANARERASLLEMNLSRALNDAMSAVPTDGEVARVLDAAKDMAAEYQPSDAEFVHRAEEILSRSSARLRGIFWINLSYELTLLGDAVLNYRQDRFSPETVHRIIQFPPEYYEAGMTILSGFASLVRERYKDSGVSVKIVQDGLKVTLIIESSAGREEIERTLEEYGDVLRGDRQPADFSGQEWERLRLEQTLSIARLQMETQNQIIQMIGHRATHLEEASNRLATSLESLVGTVDRAFTASLGVPKAALPPATRSVARRVFLSYTSEMAKYPVRPRSFVSAAERAIRNHGDIAVHMDGFTANDSLPSHVCREKVAECEVYVGIVGFRYGSCVTDSPDLSYTELEFEEATRSGLARLVFILSDQAEGLPVGQMTDRVFGHRQEDFRSRLISETGLTVAQFQTPDELQDLVYRALAHHGAAGNR